MSKWTPGPWRVAGEDKNFVYALSQSGANSFWAHVQSAGRDRITENEKAANARLIAAAPEMAELLEKASKHMAIQHKGLIAEIETLLARINGESQ